MATADRPERRRSRWVWVSVALGLAAVGLLIWALSLQSDLDGKTEQLTSSEQQLDSTSAELDATQQELDETKDDVEQLEAAQTGDRREKVAGAVVKAGGLAAAKAAYDELAEQLGATQQDLAAAQEDVEAANTTADEAAADAEAAKRRAADADDAADKAEAEAEQAKAEAQAEQSKRTVASTCARAYLSALGGLFEGDDMSAQAAGVRKDLAAITDECRGALAGGS
jgi:DNA repair exonuclease SbcCD ATPase subunit